VRARAFAALLAAALGCASPRDEAVLDAGGDAGADAAGSTDVRPLAAEAGLPDRAPAPGAADAPVAVDASSTDSGPRDASSDSAVPPSAPPQVGRRPVFVIVGDDGRRARSLDLGRTWVDEQRLTPAGPGDEVYFRGVGYGNGLFVATGYRIYTSPDGAVWTRRTNPEEQWLIGPVWHEGRFVAAGGYGYSAYSLDGLTWVKGGERGIEPARSLVFWNDSFIAATDAGNWWTTRDGLSWTVASGGHTPQVVVCGDRVTDARDCASPAGRNEGSTAFGAGVHVSVGDVVERSTDGVTWTPTFGGGYYAVAFAEIP
jgi:hypothetical protein